VDYGKMKYLQSKKHKQKHHEQKMKEVRIRPKTDPHDREIKLNQARRFLQHGDRVQFTMIFKGRERAHQDIGQEAFNEIVAKLADLSKIEQPAKMFGRRMTMVLVPAKAAPPPKPKPKPAEEAQGATEARAATVAKASTAAPAAPPNASATQVAQG